MDIKTMNVRVIHDGENVFEGDAMEFIEANQYDELDIYIIEKLNDRDSFEHSGYHIGSWKVEKI